MKIIKFLGKILALPFSLTIFVVLLTLFPIKLLCNWLNGYGKYNSMYWKFAKYAISHAIDAIKNNDHPTLMSYMLYEDSFEHVVFRNDKKRPEILHVTKHNYEETK